MALTRDPELAAQTPDDFAHAALGQLSARALFDPLLGVTSLPELSTPELFDKFLGKWPEHKGLPGPIPVAV